MIGPTARWPVVTRVECSVCGGRISANDDGRAVEHYPKSGSRTKLTIAKLKVCAGSGEKARVARG
jgi:hypothetical protein